MKQITSKDNSLYKSIRRLARSSRARREEGRVVLDGVHLVRAYLDCFGGEEVQLVIRKSADTHPEIRALIERATSVMISGPLFDQLSLVESPIGILAVAPLPNVTISPNPKSTFQILLDGIQDPGNVGAILRTAAAAGARTAHLSADCADPWSPRCLRGGMGAQFVLPLRQHDSLATLAAGLGVKLIACTPEAPISVFEADLGGHIAFIVGSEGAGVSEELLALAQQQISIPMREGVQSLNAAAAAAICFYEWVRRGERMS